MMELRDIAARNLEAVRQNKPLIHNITNFVVMNSTANALLAMGASPVMAHAPNEVEEMVSFAGALVLNIGTLTDRWVDSMLKAGAKATAMNTPIVLDPVGSGATALRTAAAKKIIGETRISVIRGNASEVLSLQRDDTTTKGVDSIHTVADATAAAQALAVALETTLAITGPIDLVTDGRQVIRVANGHPLMGFVTGTGCAATVAVGAFLAVDPNPVSATATALAYFGLAGEMAGKVAEAPGSFWVKLLDALYTITPEQLQAGCRIESE